MNRWWLRLIRRARPHLRGLGLVLLLMLTSIGLDLLKPWPLKLLVDYVLPRETLPAAVAWVADLPGAAALIGLIAWVAIGTIVLFLAREAAGIAQTYVQTGLESRMKYDLAANLFDHFQRLSLRFHGKQATGDLVRRVTTDSSCVGDLLLGVIVPIFSSLGYLVAMFVVMWSLNHWLTLIAILVIPAMILLVRVFQRPMTERSYEIQRLGGQLMAFSEQTLTALPVVQAFGREDFEEHRFRDFLRRTLSAYLRALSSQMQFRVGVNSATAAGTATIIVVGGLLGVQGVLPLGTLLIFLSYLVSLYAPLSALAYFSEGYASAGGKARRVLGSLDEVDQVRESPDSRPLPARQPGNKGHVRFEGVTFGYEPDRPILREVTLEARPGEVIALVGPTGAGKSTLASLISRFYDPWAGRITLDGEDLRSLQLASLRSHVAILFQEPFLLPLSVADNIAYGRINATRAEIIAAAQAANADDFIARLPQGYDTVIGERGATLSGGEKQRLAIARAVLMDASVLILDEPTAALDVKTEARVLEALERLMVGRTTFIIAHRLSTVRNADRIIVMEEGRVVESGKHEELLAAAGPYSRSYHIQFDDRAMVGP